MSTLEHLGRWPQTVGGRPGPLFGGVCLVASLCGLEAGLHTLSEALTPSFRARILVLCVLCCFPSPVSCTRRLMREFVHLLTALVHQYFIDPSSCSSFFSCMTSSNFFPFTNNAIVGKASVCDAGDPGSIPGLGRSFGEGNGNPLQYYCLENPMDRGAW